VTPAPAAVAEILPLASLSPSSPLRVARVIEPTDAEPLVEPGAEGEAEADSIDDIEIPSQPGGDDALDLQDAVDDPGLFEAESPAPAMALLRPATPVDLADLAEVDLDAAADAPEPPEAGAEPDGELEVEDISVSELELPTAEAQVLRTGDLEAVRPDAPRAAPPPLREIDVRFILRPLSNNVAENRLITVGERGLTIGRVEADMVLAEDTFISPRHLQLTVEHDTLFAEDLQTLNGSWVRVRTQVELRPGMCFRVGHQLLRLDHQPGRPALPEMPDRTRRYGTPRAETALCLQQMGDDNQPRNVYFLSEQGARIGRHLADIVFTDDTFMSGTHAVVLPRGERAVLRDLSSRNGTWVKLQGRQALSLGDAIMVGQTVWRVSRPVT
jgi:pSer/pThr/pTyr-binding forkhead associated (FHA) protein